MRHGGTVNSDKAAGEYVKPFDELIKAERYVPQQVFNCDKTGLIWKRIQNILGMREDFCGLHRKKDL